MSDTPTPRLQTRPARAPIYLSLGLALGLASLLPGCGGEEAPAPEPPAATVKKAARAGAAKAAQEEPARSIAEGTAPARRFDVPSTVTPASEGTAADAPATLRGVARIVGPIPKPQRIAMDHIGGCREHKGAMTETVLATETGELQNVVVYITRGVDRESVEPVPDEPAVLTQEGCVFKPHLTVLRAGQTLQIHNGDKTNHNLNARPTHGSNKGFNIMQPPKAADHEVSFPRAEIAIPLTCDIHPWMKSWVAVVDHPYYSVSGEDGAWSIELPAGDYLVEAWHERYGKLKGTVEVGPGEVGEFAFAFAAGKKRN